jgi:hypothetical protein
MVLLDHPRNHPPHLAVGREEVVVGGFVSHLSSSSCVDMSTPRV